MLAEIGTISLYLTFFAALYAVVASVAGDRLHSARWITSGRNAALLTLPLLTVSTVVLMIALLTEQYQISYVFNVTDPRTPFFYRFTALWGSQEGSLLFWSFLMSCFTTGAILINWQKQRRLMPYAIAYMMVTLAFFIGLSIFLENPFERFWITGGDTVVQTAFIPAGATVPQDAVLAANASGLNPLLRHFGMIIHPPMLYLGFVGFLIPFAFAMAALASGNLSTDWIKVTRRWTLVAWLFLTLGLILGGRWAYDVLGWGGYWGWDPVENAAFLPWLMGTAFLHSVMVQERRGMLKVWNMVLIIATFSSVIFGTFATRSGLIESVHSFARSGIGFPMFTFWAATTLISAWLIIARWKRGELKDDHEFANILSRESMFILNNVIFILLFIAVFWGSFGAPIISELFLGTEITIGLEYYNLVTPPLFLAMYLLMGIAPLTAWNTTAAIRLGRRVVVPAGAVVALLTLFIIVGLDSVGAGVGYAIVLFAGAVAVYEVLIGARARVRAHNESWPRALVALFSRQRRRYGGYIVHLGIVIIGIGVIGSTLFQQETQRTLNTGESLAIGGYEMVFDRLDSGQVAQDGRVMDIARLSLERNGREIAELNPRRDLFLQSDGSTMPMTIASAHSTIENDFYVLLVGWQEINPNQATFKVYVNPLINLVWWGGVVLIIGTVISTWPPAVQPARRRRDVPKGTGVASA